MMIIKEKTKKEEEEKKKKKKKKKEKRTIEVWTCDMEFYKTDTLPTELARILWDVSTFRRFKPFTAFNTS